ncbi:SDR family oxidoreductase [Tengunoibacter tsumagoiensis]|uniref:Short-chain dehydrogenase n=1 Tax=Tengunoibacter tsumagoiensis TaxID=2014871 RepID=A0A402AAJ2_9CHLR|nr:SDR family oxidoreductase [Tengunoibacter tsumagoiensis]GCE16118.1 short-chain dehydrogenase [Tengunoibacter tsumagoiensis]
MTAQQHKQVALITGSNRGLGFEVARQLGRQGKIIVVTAREIENAESAAQQLLSEGLTVYPHQLEIMDEEDRGRLALWLEKNFGKLDILVNNAATYTDWSDRPSTANLEKAQMVLQTNLFGTWAVTQTMLPLLRKSPHARIVNVSSGAGSHGDPQFGLTSNQGGSASYGISKAAVNALTVKLATELKATGMLINAVCPGFTATSPGMEEMGARPVAEGAASILWAALLPDDGPTGGFFRDGKPLSW